MTPEGFRQVEALYHATLEQPADERTAFLAQACAGDEALRRKIVSLVKAHEQAGDFFASPLRPLRFAPKAAAVLKPGTQLGPYGIVGSLGRGGMGEVYRARDPRLGREVAVKVLPSESSSDLERLKYFAQEARSASALNHPNIVTIYDIGQSDFGSYIAMELVDGLTLRNLLADGPLPPKKMLNLAAQVADGLARAHAAGIVHRDLKPENLMITKDGLAKVLDFGIAKLVQPAIGSEESVTPAITETTDLATILGTPGYMSPEQASGHSVDFRSDQFSLGAILYEMTTGKRAFHGASEFDTISAIIRDEPEPIVRLNPKAFPPLRWIIERCLSKVAEDRYASTLDLARELQSLRDHLPELVTGDTTSIPVPAPESALRKFRAIGGIALAIAFLATLIGVFILRSSANRAPLFRQLSFGHGNITEARFAGDGKSVIYGAAWAGKSPEVYMTDGRSPESRSLGLQGSGVFSISRSGEMAVVVGCTLNWGECIGTLAVVPSSGGAPRQILENVHSADWSRDGKALVVAQFSEGKDQLQYPIGHILYETPGWIDSARLSPRGDAIAFIDHPILGVSSGSVAVVNLSGKRRILSAGWRGLQGLTWSSNGDEVWFSASRIKPGPDGLYAVSLSGHEREILLSAGNLRIADISPDGQRVLAWRGSPRAVMIGVPPGGKKEVDLSWFDFSTVADLSADGTAVLFYEWGAGVRGIPTVYLRRTNGSDSVRLGEGKPLALSPDGKWALALQQTSPPQLVLLPTGPGEQKPLPRGAIHEFFDWAAWSPDSGRFFFSAEEGGRRRRTYVQDIYGGLPEPVTPEGFVGNSLSPDGTLLTVVGRYGGYYVYRLGTEDPEPLEGYEDGDTVIQWSADGRSLFLRAAEDLKLNIFKLNLNTGGREFWKELAPPQPAGLIGIATDPGQVRLTPDAMSYAYTYWTYPSELYVVEGLK